MQLQKSVMMRGVAIAVAAGLVTCCCAKENKEGNTAALALSQVPVAADVQSAIQAQVNLTILEMLTGMGLVEPAPDPLLQDLFARAKAKRKEGNELVLGDRFKEAAAAYTDAGAFLLKAVAKADPLDMIEEKRDKAQSPGQHIINSARQMDAAIDQWALERGHANGAPINVDEAAQYLKGGWVMKDLLGNPYEITVIGPHQIRISTTTKKALEGQGIDWGPY